MTTLTRTALFLCIVSVAQGQTTNLPMTYPSYNYGWAGVPMDYSHMENVQKCWRMDSIVYAGNTAQYFSGEARDEAGRSHIAEYPSVARPRMTRHVMEAHNWSERKYVRPKWVYPKVVRVCLVCYRCEVGHYETITEPSPYDAAVAKARELARKK